MLLYTLCFVYACILSVQGLGDRIKGPAQFKFLLFWEIR
ncbi:hypothetical protein LINGRAHAP2_LOCUS36627, partial [Linum grandiflorum]